MRIALPTDPTHPEEPRREGGVLVWPVARHRMRFPDCVRSRMAEDIRDLAAESPEGVVLDADLVQVGWSRLQVQIYGAAAGRLAHPGIAGERRQRRALDLGFAAAFLCIALGLGLMLAEVNRNAVAIAEGAPVRIVATAIPGWLR